MVGRTVPELSETIRKAYASILHNPRITIVLKDFEKPYFVAGGWLEKPGKYDLRGETTVSQAIQIAGGMKEGAKSSQVFLFRSRDNDWFEVKKLNLKRFASGKDFSEDVHLRPGDMILCPSKPFLKSRLFCHVLQSVPFSILKLFFDGCALKVKVTVQGVRRNSERHSRFRIKTSGVDQTDIAGLRVHRLSSPQTHDYLFRGCPCRIDRCKSS